MFNPPNPESFNMLVWEIVQQIPSGKVSTYGQIASIIPPSEGIQPQDYVKLSPRWVGSAMNAVPKDQSDEIPWQRVINTKGGISLPAGSEDAFKQRVLLESEGVEFNERGLVDFEVYAWEGPDLDWLDIRNLLPAKSLKKDTDSGSQMSLF